MIKHEKTQSKWYNARMIKDFVQSSAIRRKLNNLSTVTQIVTHSRTRQHDMMQTVRRRRRNRPVSLSIIKSETVILQLITTVILHVNIDFIHVHRRIYVTSLTVKFHEQTVVAHSIVGPPTVMRVSK